MERPLKFKRRHIYVAGPYTPQPPCTLHEAARVAEQNTLKAIKIGNAILAKGHYAFIPHLSHYCHIFNTENVTFNADFYYEYDMSFLGMWADSLFYITPSYGADKELALAKKLSYTIYYKLEDIPCIIIK